MVFEVLQQALCGCLRILVATSQSLYCLILQSGVHRESCSTPQTIQSRFFRKNTAANVDIFVRPYIVFTDLWSEEGHASIHSHPQYNPSVLTPRIYLLWYGVVIVLREVCADASAWSSWPLLDLCLFRRYGIATEQSHHRLVCNNWRSEYVFAQLFFPFWVWEAAVYLEWTDVPRTGQ